MLERLCFLAASLLLGGHVLQMCLGGTVSPFTPSLLHQRRCLQAAPEKAVALFGLFAQPREQGARSETREGCCTRG